MLNFMLNLKVKMSSRKVFLCVFLLFTLLSSPSAEQNCHDSTTSFSPDCPVLLLRNENLASLDLSTSTFTNLTKIFLNSNELTEVPRLPASVKATLHGLWLNGNKIASIPADYFNDFRSLNMLSLADNELTEMPAMPDFVKGELTQFHICGNKISAIPTGYFGGFSELIALTLHENKIRRFGPGTSLGHVGKLELLSMDQLDCDSPTLRVWQQIAAMNISNLIISRNGTKMRDFPCAGDMNLTLAHLATTTSTPSSSPSIAAPPHIAVSILVGICILA